MFNVFLTMIMNYFYNENKTFLLLHYLLHSSDIPCPNLIYYAVLSFFLELLLSNM